MARFLLRSVISTIITMFLVSIILFTLLAVGGGDITVKILGAFATPEQFESLSRQLGLDEPAYVRYVDWLAGNDWRAARQVGHPVVSIENPVSGDIEWWVEVDDQYLQFDLGAEDEVLALVRQADGSTQESVYPDPWVEVDGQQIFWGVDKRGRAVKWVQGSGSTAFVATQTGFQELSGAPEKYIPLRKGLLRGDPGYSYRTNRPVASSIFVRIRNTALLAGIAFAVVMPLALVLGIIAGINEGKLLDRVISVGGLFGTSTPEFVTGMFLILIVGIWFRGWVDSPEFAARFSVGLQQTVSNLVPSATSSFSSPNITFADWRKFVLPVMTLTAVELGYVIRMTRASMVEVMNTSYIRTAIIKGMPYRRVVFRHAIRNALMAPITIIMLHVNYLIGGIVVVESIFAYPGLGSYIFDSALFSDVNALEAAAMVTVFISVFTRLIGDLAYTWLNPRIRYS